MSFLSKWITFCQCTSLYYSCCQHSPNSFLKHAFLWTFLELKFFPKCQILSLYSCPITFRFCFSSWGLCLFLTLVIPGFGLRHRLEVALTWCSLSAFNFHSRPVALENSFLLDEVCSCAHRQLLLFQYKIRISWGCPSQFERGHEFTTTANSSRSWSSSYCAITTTACHFSQCSSTIGSPDVIT